MSKKKKRIFIGITALIIIAVVITVILIITGKNGFIQINRINDNPIVVYRTNDDGDLKNETQILFNYKNTYLYQIDSKPQLIEINARSIDTHKSSKLMEYSCGEELLKEDLYILNNLGVKRLVHKNVVVSDISQDGTKVIFQLDGKLNELHIREYSPEGKVTDQKVIDFGDTHSVWHVNYDASVIAYKKNTRAGLDKDDDGINPYEFNWGDIYLYRDGKVEKIAEKAFLSKNDVDSISNDGAIVYLADGNDDTKTGTLFKKEPGEEAEAIIENSTQRFGISDDGALIATIVSKKENEQDLFYQFGEEANVVENGFQYLISKDSKTLVYTIETDVDLKFDLYRVREHSDPVKIAENITLLLEVSDDGKSIAYMTNLSNDQKSGDLYIVREGQEPELIDTQVSASFWLSGFDLRPVNMYHDGSIIAYLKVHDSNNWGDLYVKQQGKEPIKVDDDVAVGFGFLD